VLSALPKDLKECLVATQLVDLRDWMEEHGRQCLETVETWMLRSLPTPREVVATVWADPSWRRALENAVVVPVDQSNARDPSRAGFLRGVDPKRGIGIVNLDGETVWVDAPSVAIPHPVLLEELDDFRSLATDLSLSQSLSQLLRETFSAPTTLAADVVSISTYQGGSFEELNHALARCRKLGFRVSGGFAMCRVWADGKVCDARYWIGDDDPTGQTETGDLLWVDESLRTMAVSAVPKVAFSEGMRMASLVFAGKDNDDA
jgi:hypothetical protein